MAESPSRSLWRRPLAREISIILLLKLIILLGIKAVWFSAPTVPENGSARTGTHLLGELPSPAPLSPPLKEL